MTNILELEFVFPFSKKFEINDSFFLQCLMTKFKARKFLLTEIIIVLQPAKPNQLNGSHSNIFS